MWGHAPACSCAVCQCFPRIFHLVGSRSGRPGYSEFIATVSNLLRHVEAEIRDLLAREDQRPPPVVAPVTAPPVAGAGREVGATSQAHQVDHRLPSSGISSKGAPPPPPPHLHPGQDKDPLDSDKAPLQPVKKEPSESKESLREVGVKDLTNPSPEGRARSSGRRRRDRSRTRDRGVEETPRERRRSRSRRDRDRDRRRRRSSSERQETADRGKERKTRAS
eukprot:s548_g31.t1